MLGKQDRGRSHVAGEILSYHIKTTFRWSFQLLDDVCDVAHKLFLYT